MDVLKFGFQYWKRKLLQAILAKLMSILALTIDLLLPMITALFIDYVIQDTAPDGEGFFAFMADGRFGMVHSRELFWNLAILFMVLLLGKLILVYAKNVLNQTLGLNLETGLRMDAFQKLLTLDSETLSEYNTGELLATIDGDTIMFKEMFCRIIPNIVDSIYVLIAVVFILAQVNLWLLMIPLVISPFFAVSLLRFKKRAKENFQMIRACNSGMNLTVQENIEAVRLVRAFANEETEKAKFDTSNENLRHAYIRQVKLSANFDALFSFIKQAAYIGSITVAAILVMKGYIKIGILVACVDYVLKIMNYITLINNTLFQMQQQIVSGHKLMNFMKCESRIPDGTNIARQERVDLQIRNASMVLDDRQLLADINLDIPFGKKVGIVGGTGSGKSLLLESLIRIHDITSGEILLNGCDIRDYTLDSLRDKFAYVFQDVFLFSNTIDYNIAYVQPDIEQDQVVAAAKHAQAHGFIMNLEDKYETIVGERGLGISGGQKQRVSIARALIKNAPVLVLDDSTSALDVETEKRLLADIKTFFPDKTLLLTAHRLSSVVDCDEILYMQDGQVIERGNFEELMRMNGHFASVYRIQQAQRKTVFEL